MCLGSFLGGEDVFSDEVIEPATTALAVDDPQLRAFQAGRGYTVPDHSPATPARQESHDLAEDLVLV